MADIATSVAKAHVLSGAGEIERISGPAVQQARILGHKFLAELGRLAAEEAIKAKKKTIMPEHIETAGKMLTENYSAVVKALEAAPVQSEGQEPAAE